jgi:putative ATPase
MEQLGYGKEYNYAHDNPGNFADQEYLPDEISGEIFYDPGKNKREEELRQFLKLRWKNKYPY